MSRKFQPHGLSLVELLVASTIFTIIILGIYSVFQSGILSYNDIADNIDIYQRANRTFEYLNQDIRNYFTYSEEKSNFQGDAAKIEFLAIVNTFIEDEMTQDIAFVSYKFENNTLFRLCRKNQESLKADLDMEYDEMLQDIEDLSFSYGAVAALDEPLEWNDLWDDTTEIPEAIKIKLNFKDMPQKTFERIIFLPQK